MSAGVNGVLAASPDLISRSPLLRPEGSAIVLRGDGARGEMQAESQPHPGFQDRAPIDHRCGVDEVAVDAA